MENQAESQIAENYKKSNEHRIRNLLSNVTPVHLIIFGVILLISYTTTKNNPDPKYNYIIYAILIAVIIVLYFKPSKEKKLLPRHIIVKIVEEEANRMKREGKEFAFDSKIFVNPHCHLKYENDMSTGTSGPIAWDVGVTELVHGSQYKKIFVFSVHPYDGIITGIKEMRFSYDGTQSHDRDIIPVGVVQGSVKTTEFGGMPK